ncbi:MAG: hypothetical protein A3D65_01355 [Candidatus Lloydbacteria bacterium RIFCSPHIGHO2_02_FULL_50_13]|uniref:Pyruvate ferredoxin oxidoreductase n=1 Tax=Candidatus Lloydbacteria bacterium RIFCSPHIGHO2_02_FULL_50_13 TaxID=1798661 RepID=A0A1G2D0T5_9BACT|nr:MAG: hypothetical protein A3D65_01355 [Candidatus Lloydbacteria bacterium RIFCSPHIGHO2_02_FULL_50_13]
MTTYKVLTGSEAAALAAKQGMPEVISAYPITPQTGIIEKLSEYIAKGELAGCEFVTVESEHSALALLNGASQAGARVFTATSSHGLLYMHEVIHWVAGARLPILMVNVNRAIGSPWNIACDRTDSLSQRDTGWLQFYASSNQEVYDMVLMGYRIAEELCLPVMVNFDGFLLSHTKEPVAVLDDALAYGFAPKERIPHALDQDDPCSVGASGTTEYYWRLKRAMADDQRRAGEVITKTMEAFTEVSGRIHKSVESYRMEDAEIAMVAMGSTWRTAEEAVDRMRAEGVKAGAVKLCQFRPFPREAFGEALLSVKKIIALDVNQYAIILDETKSALYGRTTPVYGYTVGVGGVPVTANVLTDIFKEIGWKTEPSEASQWRGVSDPPPRVIPVTQRASAGRSSSKFLTSGHRACAGCTAALIMRHILDAIGASAQVALPACCWSIIAGPNPYTPVKVPLVHCPFETAAATAAGLKRAALALGNDVTALAFAGDGGTFDIGLQALSGAAERGEDIIYVCYDNEAYMNTGGQRSSATPRGAVTETTPYPGSKGEAKKNIMKIVAAHSVPYAATASIYHLDDLKAKIEKAKAYSGLGLRFLHILAPCNPGWKVDPKDSLRMSHLAVESRVFPLVEYDHGKWRITYRPDGRATVAEYVSSQGRFAHLTEEDIARAEKAVDQYWEELEKLEKHF